jgi:transketolase
MRREFKHILFDAMRQDERIVVITADLGYKFFDEIQEKFPDRFINCGSSEMLMMGMGIGAAMSGKIPICYSIGSFLLRRPYEQIKLYLNDEKIPVKLCAGGRNKDYLTQGKTHWMEDDKYIMGGFLNIKSYWPETIEEMEQNFQKLLYNDSPSYLNLKR